MGDSDDDEFSDEDGESYGEDESEEEEEDGQEYDDASDEDCQVVDVQKEENEEGFEDDQVNEAILADNSTGKKQNNTSDAKNDKDELPDVGFEKVSAPVTEEDEKENAGTVGGDKKTMSSDSKGGSGQLEDNKYETPVKVGINSQLI